MNPLIIEGAIYRVRQQQVPGLLFKSVSGEQKMANTEQIINWNGLKHCTRVRYSKWLLRNMFHSTYTRACTALLVEKKTSPV